MSNIDHIILYIFLFYLFYSFVNYKQVYIVNNFWKISLFPIACYILILGCRYGWGNDYIWYKYRFQRPFSYKQESLGFKWLNVFLNEMGIGFIGAYIVYSLIFIVGAFILLKDYKENKYMLALFLPATLLQSTFTIRQSVAQGFAFISLHYLHKKQWKYLILMVALTYLIHPASILFFIVMTGLYYVTHHIIKPIYSIPIYLFLAFFGSILNTYVTTILGNVLPSISLIGKFNNYVQNDMWYNENAIKTEWSQGLLTLSLTTLSNIGIMYVGYISLKYSPKHIVSYVYNAVVIGLISQRLFWYFEIFRRISEMFVLTYFIPLGYAFSFLFSQDGNIKLARHERVWIRISIICILTYLVLYFGRFILMSPDYAFFWNIPNYNEFHYVAPH